MTDSQAFQDSKEAIIDCVFAFIDRMNDVCDSDNADRIVSEYIAKMNPLIEEYLDLKFAPNHERQQLWLEFRTPEQIAADEAKHKSRLRSLDGVLERLTAEVLDQAFQRIKK